MPRAAKTAPATPRPSRGLAGVGVPRLVRLSDAAARLAVSDDWFEATLLDAVFTEFRGAEGGWRKVFADEIDVYLTHTDHEHAAAAVRAYRREMGRVGQ